MINRDVVFSLMQFPPNLEVMLDVGRAFTQFLSMERARREKMNPLRRAIVEIVDPLDEWRLNDVRVNSLAVEVHVVKRPWGMELAISNGGQSCSWHTDANDNPPEPLSSQPAPTKPPSQLPPVSGGQEQVGWKVGSASWQTPIRPGIVVKR